MDGWALLEDDRARRRPGAATTAAIAQHSQSIHDWEETMNKLDLKLEPLEERIAPDALGNPGNNNPPRNNTNNPG